MRKTVLRSLAFLGLFVVGLMIMAPLAEARPERSARAGHRSLAMGGSDTSMSPMAMQQFGGSCGVGRYYLGQEVSFTYEVSYSLQIDETHGFLVDCMQGADVFLEYYGASDGLYFYAVWGQLGPDHGIFQ